MIRKCAQKASLMRGGNYPATAFAAAEAIYQAA
jgi:hypothetical protein